MMRTTCSILPTVDWASTPVAASDPSGAIDCIDASLLASARLPPPPELEESDCIETSPVASAPVPDPLGCIVASIPGAYSPDCAPPHPIIASSPRTTGAIFLEHRMQSSIPRPNPMIG